MNRLLLLLLAFSFGPLLSFCQDDEKGPGVNGWVLPKDGDTISGMITYDGFYVYHRKTKYEPATKYFLKNIKAYRIGDIIWQYECFDIIQPFFPEHTCGFARLIATGQVMLFSYEGKDMYSEETYTNYYLKKGNNPLLYLVPKNANRFKKEMSGFFFDYEDLKNKINAKEFNYEQMVPMVATYNEWFSSKETPQP